MVGWILGALAYVEGDGYELKGVMVIGLVVVVYEMEECLFVGDILILLKMIMHHDILRMFVSTDLLHLVKIRSIDVSLLVDVYLIFIILL